MMPMRAVMAVAHVADLAVDAVHATAAETLVMGAEIPAVHVVDAIPAAKAEETDTLQTNLVHRAHQEPTLMIMAIGAN